MVIFLFLRYLPLTLPKVACKVSFLADLLTVTDLMVTKCFTVNVFVTDLPKAVMFILYVPGTFVTLNLATPFDVVKALNVFPLTEMTTLTPSASSPSVPYTFIV